MVICWFANVHRAFSSHQRFGLQKLNRYKKSSAAINAIITMIIIVIARVDL